MNKLTAPILAAAMLGGAMTTTALALPVAPGAPAPASIELAQSLRNDKLNRNPRYQRRLHGDRCRYRNQGCRHYYNGWYYNDRWWLGPAIIGGAILGSQLMDRDDYDDGRSYSRRHVDWCLDRYRSYNPRNNTWLSYSGQYRQCNSPYN